MGQNGVREDTNSMAQAGALALFYLLLQMWPERSDECESQHRRDGAVWLEMKKGEGRCRADNVRELRKGYPFDVRELLHYLSWLA